MPFARVSHGAASSLVSALLDGPVRKLEEVARTRMSVHYETTSRHTPVLTLCMREAVRLPAAVVTAVLPEPGHIWVGDGGLRQGSSTWLMTRWWRPERPSGLEPPDDELSPLLPRSVELSGIPVTKPAYDGLRPDALIGQGPGLTPAGDDVVAGALVTARAIVDLRAAAWRAATMRALHGTRTTAVSRALLRHACDGYATPELAAFLRAACGGGDISAATDDLVAVGHTSGLALMLGALHTLTTRHLEGAA